MPTTRVSGNFNPGNDCNSGIRATILGPIPEGAEASATAMEFLASEVDVSRSIIDQQSSRIEQIAAKFQSITEEFKKMQYTYNNEKDELKNLIMGIQQTLNNKSAESTSTSQPLLPTPPPQDQEGPSRETFIFGTPSNLLFG